MNDWKPPILVPIAFEKCEEGRTYQIRLTWMQDKSVYLDGEKELVFDQGDDTLRAALNYLEKEGYKKKD